PGSSLESPPEFLRRGQSLLARAGTPRDHVVQASTWEVRQVEDRAGYRCHSQPVADLVLRPSGPPDTLVIPAAATCAAVTTHCCRLISACRLIGPGWHRTGRPTTPADPPTRRVKVMSRWQHNVHTQTVGMGRRWCSGDGRRAGRLSARTSVVVTARSTTHPSQERWSPR